MKYYLLTNGTVVAVLPVVFPEIEEHDAYINMNGKVVFGSIAGHMLTNEITATEAMERQPELFDRTV